MKIIDWKYMSNEGQNGPLPAMANSYVVLEDWEAPEKIVSVLAYLTDGLFGLTVSTARPPESMDDDAGEDAFTEGVVEEYESLDAAASSRYYPYLIRATQTLNDNNPHPVLEAALKTAPPQN